jgi:hypothetical protein
MLIMPIHAGILLFLLTFSAASHARDYGQDNTVPPEVKTWIESLKNRFGYSCCATADGYRPEAVDWDMTDNHYRVKIDNTWIVVPDTAVIKGPNRIGYAIVWLNSGSLDSDGYRVVRCFLPGPAS